MYYEVNNLSDVGENESFTELLNNLALPSLALLFIYK